MRFDCHLSPAPRTVFEVRFLCFALLRVLETSPAPQCQCKQWKQGWAFHLPSPQGVTRWPLPPSCPTSCTHREPAHKPLGTHLAACLGESPVFRGPAGSPGRGKAMPSGCQATAGHTVHMPRCRRLQTSPGALGGATSLIIPPLVPWGRVREHRIIVTDHVLEREPRRPGAGGKQAMKTALCLQPPYTGLVFLHYDNWVKH